MTVIVSIKAKTVIVVLIVRRRIIIVRTEVTTISSAEGLGDRWQRRVRSGISKQ